MTEAYSIFDKELREKYKELQIKHLNEVDLPGGSNASILSNILRSKSPVVPLPYSDFKLLHEMDFITQDLKYIIGTLFLLRPYINNPAAENNTYSQTVGDRRYLMHVTFGLQAIYNFWDRIGDLLWHYFSTNLAERDVYFNRVIERIPEPYNKTSSYLDLKSIYDTDLKSVMRDRIETVHYFQPESRHYWGHVENYHEKDKIKEMFEEKFGYADLMKKNLALAIKGFELMLNLIDQLPER